MSQFPKVARTCKKGCRLELSIPDMFKLVERVFDHKIKNPSETPGTSYCHLSTQLMISNFSQLNYCSTSNGITLYNK